MSFGALTIGTITAGAQSASPQATGRVEVRTHRGTAGARDYRLFVPASYDGTQPVPLIVMLHGCTQDAADIARGTRLDAHAARAGAIVAYPQQPATANPRTCWNWYDTAHQTRDAGEPALVAGIAREVVASYRIDGARVYLGGVSAGGAMAVITAAAYPELFAAAASHSGVAVGAARSVMEAIGVMSKGPSQALPSLAERDLPPLLVVQGGADAIVSAANADAMVVQWSGTSGRAAEEAGEQGGYAFARRTITDETGRVRAERWLVQALGHAWSGGSPEGTFTDAKGPDATAIMLRFFLAQRKTTTEGR